MQFRFLILLVFILTPFSSVYAFQNEPSEIFGMSFNDSKEDLYKLFPEVVKVDKVKSDMNHFKISGLNFIDLNTKPTMFTFIDNKLFSVLIEFDPETGYILANVPNNIMSYVDNNIVKIVSGKKKQQRVKLKSILMYLLESKYGKSKLIKDEKGVHMQWTGLSATLSLHLDKTTLLIVSSKAFKRFLEK